MATEKVELVIDAKDRASKIFDKLGAALGGVFGKMSKIGKIAAGVAGGIALIGTAAVAAAVKVGKLTKGLADAAAPLDATAERFENVFRSLSGRFTGFFDDFALRIAGISENEMKDFLARAGAIVQGLGFFGEESVEASKSIVELSTDLASFNDIPTERAITAVTNAMVSQRRELKRMGIVLTEQEVRQKAVAKGLADTTAEVTSQQEAVATLDLIYQKMQDQGSLGDAVRTQDDLDRIMRSLNATFREFRQTVLIETLPALQGLFIEIRDVSLEIVNSGLPEFFGKQLRNSVDILTGSLFVLKDVLHGVSDLLTGIRNVIPNIDLEKIINLVQNATPLFQFLNTMRQVGTGLQRRGQQERRQAGLRRGMGRRQQQFLDRVLPGRGGRGRGGESVEEEARKFANLAMQEIRRVMNRGGKATDAFVTWMSAGQAFAVSPAVSFLSDQQMNDLLRTHAQAIRQGLSAVDPFARTPKKPFREGGPFPATPFDRELDDPGLPRPPSVGEPEVVEGSLRDVLRGVDPDKAGARNLGSDLGGRITEGLKNGLKRGAQFALSSLIQGLFEDQVNFMSILKGLGVTIANALLGGLFSGLGIFSPSKKAMFAVQKITEGFEVEAKRQRNRIQSVGDRVANDLIGPITGLSGVGMAGAGRGGMPALQIELGGDEDAVNAFKPFLQKANVSLKRDGVRS